MTISDLIAKLRTMPQNAEVELWVEVGCETRLYEVDDVEDVSLSVEETDGDDGDIPLVAIFAGESKAASL